MNFLDDETRLKITNFSATWGRYVILGGIVVFVLLIL